MDIHTAVAMAGDGSQQGEIQILHATPEQISQLQQAQHIQILSGDQVIGVGAYLLSWVSVGVCVGGCWGCVLCVCVYVCVCVASLSCVCVSRGGAVGELFWPGLIIGDVREEKRNEDM